jgi:mannose-6-phosphate isomerase-like protein (cupin superfamily)
MYCKNIDILAEGENFSAINLGNLEDISDFAYLHPKLNQMINGKVFVGTGLKTTGAEISFQILPPKTEIPFLHQHTNHEEIYFFIKGSGQFMIDDRILDIREGSVIRISPEGKRTWRNHSDEPLIFMVIQTREKSIGHHFIEDGFRVDGEIKWDTGSDKMK